MSDDMNLEAWLQSKISRAKDQIDSVYDYMMYKDKEPEPVAVSVMPAASPMATTYGAFLNRMGEETEMQEAKKQHLDPVGKEDDDINNDGKVNSSDSYLKNRRKAVSQAIKNEEVEEIELNSPALIKAFGKIDELKIINSKIHDTDKPAHTNFSTKTDSKDKPKPNRYGPAPGPSKPSPPSPSYPNKPPRKTNVIY